MESLQSAQNLLEIYKLEDPFYKKIVEGNLPHIEYLIDSSTITDLKIREVILELLNEMEKSKTPPIGLKKLKQKVLR